MGIDEVIKALRCEENLGSEACKDCHYGKEDGLCLGVDRDAADLLEQQAEIIVQWQNMAKAAVRNGIRAGQAIEQITKDCDQFDICCNRAEIVREKAIQALQGKAEREKLQEKCSYCNSSTNDFIHLNGNTADCSGLLLSVNRQGIFRVRHFPETFGGFDTQESMMFKYCPMCGRKLVKE